MEDLKRIGLYGGTFDPPHNAHILLAEWVVNHLKLDYVYFIPTAIHAFKNRKRLTPQDTRYKMLTEAIACNPKFRISKIEFDRSAVSYTVDTLESFCSYENIENSVLFYIIGMDNLLEFPLWKDPLKILNLAQLVVMRRPGYQTPHDLKNYLNRARILDTPSLAISSSQIRKLVLDSLPYKHLVPGGVYKIIQSQDLYQSG
jgi:nicotinate-nucleotide adenylyltransferase